MIQLYDLESKYNRKLIIEKDPSNSDLGGDKEENDENLSSSRGNNDTSEENTDPQDGTGDTKQIVIPVNEDEDIIIQDATVVLSQSERINQQIRDDVNKHAYTVKEENIVALPGKETDTTTNTVPSDKSLKQRHHQDCTRSWAILLLVSAVLVGIVLATTFTVLHFTKKTGNDNQNDDRMEMVPSSSPTIMIVPTAVPTVPPTTPQFGEMQAFLKTQNLSSSAWSDPESPQYRALNWISNFDSYIINKTSEELPAQRIAQRYSLATLYYATGGDLEDEEKNQWNKNYNFLSNRSECLWNDGIRNGVICSSNYAYIIRLEFNNLNGTIPVEIGSLKKLGAIVMWYNSLYGVIPETLYNLDSMLALVLDANKLSGTISPSISKLRKLQTCSLMRNQLNGTIPPTIAQLTDLNGLALYSNQLTGTIPDIFSQNGVITMNRLSQINIGNNQFNGTVPASIWNITTLTVLALNHNDLSGDIPTTIGKLTRTRLLDLASNRFNSSIPSEIQFLSNLEIVSFANNQLTGSIPSTMMHLSKLKFFSLGANKLKGEIPPSLGNLTNLKTLILFGNVLSGTVPVSFQQLKNLTNLQLAFNSLSGNLNHMDFMCENKKVDEYFQFDSDCAGTPPEIICPCCTICCDANDNCFYT